MGKSKKDEINSNELFGYIKTGDYKKAYSYITDFDIEKTTDPDVFFTCIFLGFYGERTIPENIKFSQGDVQGYEKQWQFSGEIEKTLGLFLYLFQNDKNYFMKMLDSMELLGFNKEAVDLFEKHIGQPKTPEQLNKMGFLYWQMKDYKTSLNFFKKSVVLGNDPLIYNSIALIYNELGNHVLSKKYFLDGLRQFPDDITLMTNYGVLLYNLGELENANRIIDKLKEYNINPNFLHAGIGKILPPEYEIDLEEELKINPKSPSIVLEIGKYLLRRGELERLIEFIKKEMNNGITSPRIYSMLSYAYYYNFKFSEAEQVIFGAMKQYCNNISLLLALIFLYVHTSKYNHIEPVLEKIKEVDPMYIESLFNVAMILENSGILSKAKMLYNWYLNTSISATGKMVAQIHLEIIESKLKTRKETEHEKYF